MFIMPMISSKDAANGLHLPEESNFEAIHFQISIKLDGNTKLDLIVEPPFLGSCCCVLLFSTSSL